MWSLLEPGYVWVVQARFGWGGGLVNTNTITHPNLTELVFHSDHLTELVPPYLLLSLYFFLFNLMIFLQ